VAARQIGTPPSFILFPRGQFFLSQFLPPPILPSWGVKITFPPDLLRWDHVGRRLKAPPLLLSLLLLAAFFYSPLKNPPLKIETVFNLFFRVLQFFFIDIKVPPHPSLVTSLPSSDLIGPLALLFSYPFPKLPPFPFKHTCKDMTSSLVFRFSPSS